MAEAWLRQTGGDAVEAESAGTEPAGDIDPLAVRVMHEVGIDVSSVRPRSIAGLRGEDYDLVIVLNGRRAEDAPRLEGGREVATWTFDDPTTAEGTDEERLKALRRLRDELRTRVGLFVNATLQRPAPPASAGGERRVNDQETPVGPGS